MSHRLIKLSVTLGVIGTLSTGCATVDLNDMAGPAMSTSATSEVNVVQRAVTKLKNAFASKGLVEKTSRKRMQSAAKILLNGLEDKNVSSANSEYDYNSPAKPVSIVLADIEFAQNHVLQTTKAAEVYLAMAPAERNLREELASLETALIASRHAGIVFQDAMNGEETAAIASYMVTVDGLRSVTDEFGARVRLQQSEKLASASLTDA